MSPSDRAWIEHAVHNWDITQRQLLHLTPAPLPTIVAIDQQCTYVAASPQNNALHWKASPHSDTVILPDGKRVPLGLISFASPLDAGAATGYFAMSLPSLWRANKVESTLGIEPLIDGVFLHEMAHTRQFYFANPTLDALSKRYGLPDDIGDDSLQAAFSGNKQYVAEYEKERDLLLAAALSRSDKEARSLAKQALNLMRSRRNRWFRGENKKWRDLDEIFLTMEGVGQWVMYAWYTGPSGLHLPPATAIDFVRRKRQWWTQDEGLAVFLVVDRLLPDWQSLAFAPKPLTAESLLERATR
ncbi:MAG TPA: hypothetical protein VF135_01860 [Terriglobales bacterium]